MKVESCLYCFLQHDFLRVIVGVDVEDTEKPSTSIETPRRRAQMFEHRHSVSCFRYILSSSLLICY